LKGFQELVRIKRLLQQLLKSGGSGPRRSVNSRIIWQVLGSGHETEF
jgi:hypothetical protein